MVSLGPGPAHRQAVHHGGDPGDTPGQRKGMRNLRRGLDPPGQLDDTVANGADIDSPRLENGVVSEHLEHPLLQHLPGGGRRLLGGAGVTGGRQRSTLRFGRPGAPVAHPVTPLLGRQRAARRRRCGVLRVMPHMQVGNRLGGELGIVVGQFVERIGAAFISPPAVMSRLTPTPACATPQQAIDAADPVGE